MKALLGDWCGNASEAGDEKTTMTLKKLPSECITPLRLKEITLHGIGSYLRPARLEIRPLTILCGPNGVGKSTWVKVLNLLANAADNETFPLSLAEDPESKMMFNVEAAELRDSCWPAPDWDSPFGPLGTISLSFDCVKPVRLALPRLPSGCNHDRTMVPSELGRGDTLHLRWTNQYRTGSEAAHVEAFRVTVNGKGLERRSTAGEESLWTVEDAPSVTTKGQSKATSLGASASGRPISRERLCSAICRALSSASREAMRAWKCGFFHISAIRKIQTDEQTLSSGWTAEQVAASLDRRVGADGKWAHRIANKYQFNAMLDPRSGHPYFCPQPVAGTTAFPVDADADIDELLGLLQLPETWQWLVANRPDAWQRLVGYFRDVQGRLPAKHKKLIDLAIRVVGAARTGEFKEIAAFFKAHSGLGEIWPETVKERTKRVTTETDARFAGGIDIPCGMEMIGVVEDTDHARFRDTMHEVVSALQTLYRNDEFMHFVLSAIRNDAADEKGDGLWTSDFMEFLSRLPKDALCEYEKWYLRYWAIRLIGRCSIRGVLHTHRFDTVLRVWLWRLLEMRKQTEYAADIAPSGKDDLKSGYLCSYRPQVQERNDLTALHRRYANTFVSGSLAHFSAGVHQVFPMLVQFNVMKMNELCAVENPEVHLHPGLQLKFTEFFIENAKIGKFALLETHSDLLIRRVMRAMREEDIRGSWVNICFVHGEDAPEYKSEKGEMPQSAVAEPLRIEQGRIANWPEGFLDDDTKESAKLMQALYGTRLGGKAGVDE